VRVTTTDIPGLLLIEPDVFRDPRGLFLETYHARRYEDAGIPRGRRALAGGMEQTFWRRIGSKSMCRQAVHMDSA
jgi:hypothetical protein